MSRAGAAVASVLLAACGGYRAHEGAADPGDDGTDGDCAPGVEERGCPCDALEPSICFDGELGTLGTGACVPGLRECTDGAWGECVGQVVAGPERCNEVDDDCDGEVDEEVLSACGNCDPDCTTIGFGPEDGKTPFDLEDGWCIELTPAGDLTLEPSWGPPPRIWIPNTAEGTISAIDTRDREEIGRYETSADGANGAPSRTSVGWDLSVAVANRAPGGQSTVSRILPEDCDDADGDGVVETSTGREDVRAFGDDECVVWTAEVGEIDGFANAVAVQERLGLDGVVEERVFVGLGNERRFVELDFADGTATGVEIDVDPCGPYGAAIDRDGSVWVACGDRPVVRFDAEGPDFVETLDPAGTNLGITVDENGVVWTGGQVARYDPEAEEWTAFPGVTGYGIVSDGSDGIWVGECARDGVDVGTCRIDGDTLEIDEVDARSRGVAADWDGYVWGIPSSGIVDVVDSESLEVDETVLDDCDGVGGACLVGPDAYSDMAGYQLRNAATCPGTWSAVVEGCGPGTVTTWVGLDWEVDAPPGTLVDFMVRTGASLADLAIRPWVAIASVPPDEAPIAFADWPDVARDAAFLEVQVTLESGDRASLPVLHTLGVQRSCR